MTKEDGVLINTELANSYYVDFIKYLQQNSIPSSPELFLAFITLAFSVFATIAMEDPRDLDAVKKKLSNKETLYEFIQVSGMVLADVLTEETINAIFTQEIPKPS